MSDGARVSEELNRWLKGVQRQVASEAGWLGNEATPILSEAVAEIIPDAVRLVQAGESRELVVAATKYRLARLIQDLDQQISAVKRRAVIQRLTGWLQDAISESAPILLRWILSLLVSAIYGGED